MPRPELHTLDVEVRFAPADTGAFSGYASIFGEPDSFGDTIKPGAFRKAVNAFATKKSVPAMFWMHRQDEPIGTWTEMAEDRKGLKVSGQLVLATTRGAESYELMKAGAVNGLSIGFRARASERGPNGGRVLTDIDLVEISLVSLPAASKARVTALRSIGRSWSAAAFVKACREASRSMSMR